MVGNKMKGLFSGFVDACLVVMTASMTPAHREFGCLSLLGGSVCNIMIILGFGYLLIYHFGRAMTK